MNSPSQISSNLNSYIYQISNYNAGANFSYVKLKLIKSTAIDLAVPSSTNSAQWAQIQQTAQYAASKGVQFNVTVIK